GSTMNYVRTRLASTRFSVFYFVVSPFFPVFFVPLLATPKVSRKRRLLALRRGLSDLCRGCPTRSIRRVRRWTDWPWRGEPLTPDFEDATLLSRSYRVGSVSVPGQPRWLNSICGEQDDPL